MQDVGIAHNLRSPARTYLFLAIATGLRPVGRETSFCDCDRVGDATFCLALESGPIGSFPLFLAIGDLL